MKAKYMYLLLLVGLVLCGCAWDYKQDDKSVTVRVKQSVEGGPALVRLEVLGDKIIHVSATPEKRFADKESLAVLPQNAVTDFSVSEHDGVLAVSTESL